MNERKSKKLRRELRNKVESEWRGFYAYAQSRSLRERLAICWIILWRTK